MVKSTKRPADEELANPNNAKKTSKEDIEIDAQLLKEQASSVAVDTASAAVAVANKESDKGAQESTSKEQNEGVKQGDENVTVGLKQEQEQEQEDEGVQKKGEDTKDDVEAVPQELEKGEENEDEEKVSEVEKPTPQEQAAQASDEHYQRYQQEVQNQAPPQPTQLPPKILSDSGKPQHGTEEWHRQRRENHKEVERKRREAINVGIRELAHLIPTTDTNKAQILQRSVEYIKRLKENENNNIEKWTLEKLLTEQAVSELSASNEKLKHELELAYREIEQLKRANKK